MLFLISLAVAALFTAFCGETLRKHPAPFYLAAAVLSTGAVCLVTLHPAGLPAWFTQYPAAMLTKGSLATAFWAIVMWTGALKNGSSLMKRLMPVRGQLSIFAAILTLGHAAGYAVSMLPRWLRQADVLNLTVSILLLVIMLPLTVISVRKIRRKMKAKQWKSIQRFAYLFYLLIPVHVLAVSFRQVRAGRSGARLTLAVYLAVFLGYGVCRLRKAYLARRKNAGSAATGWAAGAAFVLLFGAGMLAIRPERTPADRAVPTAEAAVQSDSGTETTAESGTETSASAQTAETTGTAASGESAGTGQTGSVTSASADETAASAAQTSASAKSSDAAQTEGTSASSSQRQSTAAQTASTAVTTATAAKARIYKDGTFTGTAYGYDGNISVRVTVRDDVITDISASTEESDDSFFFDAKGVVIPAILKKQSPSVDACSGATFSSEGIMGAVRAALESAKN